MVTLIEAFEKFISIKYASLREEKTIRWYQSIVGACIEELGAKRNVQSINEDDLLEYVGNLRKRDERYVKAIQKPTQQGGLARDSVRSHIRALKAFWRWASHRYDIKDPMYSISMPKASQPKPKTISPENFVKLFNATEGSKYPTRDRALLAVLADTGARRAGVLQIQVSGITNRRFRVIEKNFRERDIFWTHFTDQLVQQWLEARDSQSDALWTSVQTGEPLQDSGINQILKRLKKRAGVKGRVNPHSFRHNFARMYLQSGGDLVTLARILGHRDINVTAMTYAIFTSDELSQMQAEHSPVLRMLEIK